MGRGLLGPLQGRKLHVAARTTRELPLLVFCYNWQSELPTCHNDSTMPVTPPFLFTPLYRLSLSQLVRVTIKGNMNVLRVCSSLICIESLTIRLLSVSVPPYLPLFRLSALLFCSFCFRPRNMTYFCTHPSKGNFH